MPPSNMKAMAMGTTERFSVVSEGWRLKVNEGTAAYQEAEVGRIAGAAQNVVVEIALSHPLLAQFLFGKCGRAVVRHRR